MQPAEPPQLGPRPGYYNIVVALIRLVVSRGGEHLEGKSDVLDPDKLALDCAKLPYILLYVLDVLIVD